MAWSGGVDSTYLAAVASETLGPNALLVTGLSPSVPSAAALRNRQLASERRWNHLEVDTDELSREGYRANGTDRCFHCKTELWSILVPIARERAIALVVDGTNADDLGDFRPGRVAASDAGVGSPLAELGFTKAEIREASRARALPTADDPASPCLASRLPHGFEVNPERLRVVETAEEILRGEGFRELRVRHFGSEARIEVPSEDVSRASGLVDRLREAFRPLGFESVTVDPAGLRSGHLSREALRLPSHGER